MSEITLTKEESMHLPKALSQIDGVLMVLKDVPDAAYTVLEEVSEMIEGKLRG